MKNLNKLLVALFLALSFNAMASSVESITLKDNSVISQNKISRTHFNLDNTIDFVELNDGSKVEGIEVKKVNFSLKQRFGIQTMGAVRTGGDGSGG
jgi:hypothetical protein